LEEEVNAVGEKGVIEKTAKIGMKGKKGLIGRKGKKGKRR